MNFLGNARVSVAPWAFRHVGLATPGTARRPASRPGPDPVRHKGFASRAAGAAWDHNDFDYTTVTEHDAMPLSGDDKQSF
jgi:hypothetical protein